VIALGFFVYKNSLLYRNDYNSRIQEIESSAEKRENKFYEQLSESREVLERFNDTLIRIDAKLESIERIIGNRQEKKNKEKEGGKSFLPSYFYLIFIGYLLL